MQKQRITKGFEFLQKDNEKRLVFGVVLIPDEVDAQDDILDADEIENASHEFMLNSGVIGQSHEGKAQAKVVESFICPVDMEINGQDIKQGSWLMTTKILDDDLWNQVKSGEFTGYSIGGIGKRMKGGE